MIRAGLPIEHPKDGLEERCRRAEGRGRAALSELPPLTSSPSWRSWWFSPFPSWPPEAASRPAFRVQRRPPSPHPLRVSPKNPCQLFPVPGAVGACQFCDRNV